MRQRTGWDVAIGVVALLLVCGASRAWAQDTMQGMTQGSTQGMSQGTGGSGQMGMSQGSSSQGSSSQGSSMSLTEAQQQLEVARLRTEVARLQQQLVQMGAQLEQARAMQGASGTGGSGTGGTDATPANGTNASMGSSMGTSGSSSSTNAAPVDNTGVGGTGSSVGTGSAPGTGGEGISEVNILYTGRVRSVSDKQLVLEDAAGAVRTLSLAQGVRVFDKGQPVTREQLTEGRQVRTSADISARGHPVTRIDLLPAR